jgi:excisionase family DNA binding protein
MFDREHSSAGARMREMWDNIALAAHIEQHGAPHNGSDGLLTAREAAKFLSISEKTLWTRTKRGDIAAVRIGNSVRYNPQELSRYINDSQQKHTG